MVAIVTDSAANLPADTARALRIEVVPLVLRFGDRTYRDGADLTPTDFYRRLVTEEVAASTSSPSPGEFLEAFRRVGERDIVCVTVAGTMSSTHQDAVLAARDFDGRVEVVDSLSASLAEGFVALEAARCAGTGADMEAVAERARDVARRTRLVATVDTFEFLRRSGRVTKLQAYAATMLDIKPVFRFEAGDVAPVARPRTRRRALERVMRESLSAIDGRPVHLAALHAAAEEDAQWLVREIADRAPVVERFVVEVTPVIGAHTGPGLAGTAFFCE